MWVLNVARLGVLWLVFCHLSVCCGEKDLHAFVCAVSRNRPTLPLDVRPRVASGGGGGEGIFFFFFSIPLVADLSELTMIPHDALPTVGKGQCVW